MPKTAAEAVKKRRIKRPNYKSFRISKRIKHPKAPIKGSFRLFALSMRTLVKHWRIFGGIVLIYVVLTVILVQGFGVGNSIAGLKAGLQGLSGSNLQRIGGGLSVFTTLIRNTSGAPTDVAGAYQTMLLIVISLVVIWTLRQSLASKVPQVTIRDAFYKSLYPVVPFLLVLLVITLQLLPLALAGFLYNAVIGGGLAVTAIEKGLWIVLLALFALLSFYLVSSSIFALYIVTLPNMTPTVALRSARELVRYRRWIIMRKVLFLPLGLIVMGALIVAPLIFVAPVVAGWVFLVLSTMSLAVVHSYLYSLYRELL